MLCSIELLLHGSTRSTVRSMHVQAWHALVVERDASRMSPGCFFMLRSCGSFLIVGVCCGFVTVTCSHVRINGVDAAVLADDASLSRGILRNTVIYDEGEIGRAHV